MMNLSKEQTRLVYCTQYVRYPAQSVCNLYTVVGMKKLKGEKGHGTKICQKDNAILSSF